MTQRPRLAGDGRLLLPADVGYDAEREAYMSRFGDTLVDPFEWTEDRLLLAESFARLGLADRAGARTWFLRHGAVDWRGLRGVLVGARTDPGGNRWHSEDREHDIAADQEGVGWLLRTLARLSEQRASQEWDPVWGQVVLDGAAEGRIIGGPFAGRLVFPRRLDSAEVKEEQKMLLGATKDWARVVVLNGAQGNVELVPRDRAEADLISEIEARASRLGRTWLETVELVRLILEPYLRIASERLFTTELVRKPGAQDSPPILVPHEERVWRSVMPPIHLQIFEALRRITEGEPGAATCRECERPFLVLDARRRLFCNERERFRHAQRERRKRLRSLELTGTKE